MERQMVPGDCRVATFPSFLSAPTWKNGENHRNLFLSLPSARFLCFPSSLSTPPGALSLPGSVHRCTAGKDLDRRIPSNRGLEGAVSLLLFFSFSSSDDPPGDDPCRPAVTAAPSGHAPS
ncbi:hypothetical protein NL676_038656 [Syzygium grande]|nr:hypothetical protein NL676_038656 [Syzygium grande]